MHPATTYLLLQGLSSLGLSMTMTSYSPYLLRELHISPADVELLNACFLLTIFSFELPTGMMADGRGRAWSVRMGYLFHAGGLIAYAFASGFWSALLAEVIEGVGFAFVSGSLSAWITDALDKRGESERLRPTFAKEAICSGGAFIFGSQAGHLLSLISFRLPWILAGTFFCSALLLASLKMNGDGESAVRVTEIQAFRMAWERLRDLPGLRWGGAAAVVFGLVIPFNHFWSPYFRTFVDDIYIGLIWMPIFLSLIVSGWMAKRGALRERGAEATIVITLIVTGGTLALMGIVGSLRAALALAMIHEIGRGLFRPQLELFFQRQFESSYRATAGSVLSFIKTLGHSGILLFVWYALRGQTVSREMIADLWFWCGLVLVAGTALLFALRPRKALAAQPGIAE